MEMFIVFRGGVKGDGCEGMLWFFAVAPSGGHGVRRLSGDIDGFSPAVVGSACRRGRLFNPAHSVRD